MPVRLVRLLRWPRIHLARSTAGRAARGCSVTRLAWSCIGILAAFGAGFTSALSIGIPLLAPAAVGFALVAIACAGGAHMEGVA